MTTNVDILFKELPATSGARDRISRPAATSGDTATVQGSNALSENKSAEKPFVEHLETENNSAPHENNKVPQNVPAANEVNGNSPLLQSASTPQESSEVGANAHIIPADEQAALAATQTPGGSVISTPGSATVINNVEPAPVTRQALLSEKVQSPAPDNSNENSALNHIKSQQGTVPGVTISDNAPAGESASLVQTAPSPSVARTPAAAPQSVVQPDETQPGNIASPETSTPTAGITAVVVDHPQVPADLSDPEIVPAGKNSQLLSAVSATEPEAPTTANKGGISDAVIKIVTDAKTTTVDDGPALIQTTETVAREEIGASVSAMARAMRDDIANTELMTKPVLPQDTVSVESIKTLPMAPLQVQSVNQNNASTNKKSAASSTTARSVSSAGAAAGINSNAASKAAQAALASASSKSALINAQTSDITLEFTASGQKSEPAPLQPLSLNGQSGLSNGVAMTAQELNIQKTSAALSQSFKTDVPVSTKMINEQITVAINKNIAGGQNNFSIRLHPAELGQVDIRLEFMADGKMQAAMTVESERTLSLLQRDQAALEKALQEAGINLSNKNLSFSLMKQQQQNDGHKFAASTSSGEDNVEDGFMPVAAMQNTQLGYSSQALDISV